MMLKLFIKSLAYLALIVGFSIAKAGAYEDFFQAVRRDDGAAVEALLVRGFDPNARDEKGQSALFLSQREGSFKAASVLLLHPQTRVDLLNAAGESALMMAALKGHVDWVNRLLDKGARLEGPAPAAWTALHYAATGPEPRTVQALLARGALVNARSPNGTTPLMMAARYGAEASVSLLLQAGADAALQNEGALRASDFAKLAGRDALAQRLAQPGR